MKNPTILFLLWKIFFWISVGIWAMLVLVDLLGGRLDWEGFLGTTKLFLICTALLMVLTAIGYLLYAVMQGYKYCVIFEMDDHGVTHTQMPSQFKKAQAAAAILVFLGAASGKPGAVGTGLLAGSKSSMSSSWDSVKDIEFLRKNDVIKVNGTLNKNQVYALPEDYPFVEDFIRSHVSKKCKIHDSAL